MSVEELLRDIRDRLTEGRLPGGPLPRQATLYDGVELPLVLATIPSDPKDIRRFGPSYVEAWKQDSHHYTEGLILVQVDSVKPAGVVTFAAEIQVVGFISGVPDILATAALNSNTGPLPVSVTRPYDYLRVGARQMVDGLPDTSTDSIKLDVTVTARMAR